MPSNGVSAWRLADGASTPLFGHAQRVTAVVDCPDGHHLASASVDRTVGIWDVTSCQSLSWEGFGDQVQAVDCRGASPLVAKAGDDGVVRVGDGRARRDSSSATKEPFYTVRFAPLTHARFRGDGQTLSE